MSHKLNITVEKVPGAAEVLGTVSEPNLRVRESLDYSKPWPEGITRLYLDGISTRVTEVSRSGKNMAVRILSLACTDDCELAFKVTEQIAKVGAGTIESETFGELTISDFRNRFHYAWSREQAESGGRALVTLIESDRGPIEIPGPIRSFFIGRRLLEELKLGGPKDHLTDRVMDALRRVQYLPSNEYFAAGTFEASSSATGEKIQFAIWGPGRHYLIPPVKHILVSSGTPDDSESFLIEAASLGELAGDRCYWIDEKQRILHPFTETEWPAVLERARKMEVTP